MPKRKPTPDIAEVQRRFSYDKETGRITTKIPIGRWGRIKAGSFADLYTSDTGYRHIWIAPWGMYKAHYIAWLLVYGTEPTGEIDHINRLRHDNRLINLRDITLTENRWNSSPRNGAVIGIKGIDISRDKYRVRIQAHGKARHIGYFPTLVEAVEARENAEKMYHTIMVHQVVQPI